MIEMNLVDSPSYIVGNYSAGKAKKGAGVLILLAILFLIPLLSVSLVRVYFEVMTARNAPQTPLAPQQETQTLAPRLRTADEDAQTQAAVVANPNLTARPPLGETNYTDMTKWEQINYEVKFTALALEEFAKFSPPEVTFNTIRVFDYKSLIAEGTAATREPLSRMLLRIHENSEWNLSPRPQTNIRDAKTFYSFRLEADFTPAMARLVPDPINPDNRPDIHRLDGVKDRIVRLARTSGLRNVSALDLVSSVNEPNEKLFIYRLRFNGEFQRILDFVRALSIMREPIRCQNLTINKGTGQVEGTATLVVILQ